MGVSYRHSISIILHKFVLVVFQIAKNLHLPQLLHLVRHSSKNNCQHGPRSPSSSLQSHQLEPSYRQILRYRARADCLVRPDPYKPDRSSRSGFYEYCLYRGSEKGYKSPEGRIKIPRSATPMFGETCVGGNCLVTYCGQHDSIACCSLNYT